MSLGTDRVHNNECSDKEYVCLSWVQTTATDTVAKMILTVADPDNVLGVGQET